MLHRVLAPRVCCHASHSYSSAQALAKSIFPLDLRRKCAPRQHPQCQSTESATDPKDDAANIHGVTEASGAAQDKTQRSATSKTAPYRIKRVSAGAVVEPDGDVHASALDDTDELALDHVNESTVEINFHKFSRTGPVIRDPDLLARISEFQSGRIRDFGEEHSEPFSPSLWAKHMRLLADVKHVVNLAAHYRGSLPDDLPQAGHDLLEYEPVVLGMTEDVRLALPWRRKFRDTKAKVWIEKTHGAAATVLGEEILDFMQYIRPTPLEAKARQAVYAEVDHMVKDLNNQQKVEPNDAQRLKPFGVELFGSSRNGLAYCTSDIDARVFETSRREEQPSAATVKDFGLGFFQHANWGYGAFEKPVLRKSRFPSIATHHTPSGLDVQLVCNQPTTRSIRLIAKYTADLPCFEPLYHILRQTLRVRGADIGFHGGLTSYPLAMMIVAVLKKTRGGDRPASPKLVAEYLLEFLRFYAYFPTRTKGIIVDPFATFLKRPAPSSSTPTQGQSTSEGVGAAINEECDPELPTEEAEASSEEFYQYKRPPHIRKGAQYRRARQERGRFSEIDPLVPYLLCVEDPAFLGHDLGGRVLAIKHITATFRHLFETLQERMREFDAMGPSERAADDSSLLLPLVGRVHEQIEARRVKLQGYGLQQSLREKHARDTGSRRLPMGKTAGWSHEVRSSTRVASFVPVRTHQEVE